MKRLLGLGTILSVALSLVLAPIGHSGDAIPVGTGEITNIKVSSPSIDAGQSVTITFDVLLTSAAPPSSSYTVVIGASTDENGDSWTDETWRAQATLVGGDQGHGSWSAQVTVAATAFTGDYSVWVTTNSKLIKVQAASTNIQIKGTIKPIIIPMQGTISNIATDKSTINAGDKVVISFDLELIAAPTNFQAIRTSIGAFSDEDGDPWTSESWQSPPSTRILGTDLKGRWSSEITIPTTAFSGNYIATILQNNKLLTLNGSAANLQINGVSKPIITPLSGSAFSISSSATKFAAGQTYDFEFYVSLNRVPETPVLFAGYVMADLDENGEPSQPSKELWNKGQLISGDYGKGKWKVPITLPADMYSGTYVFKVVAPNKTILVPPNGFTFDVAGLTPIPPITPTYVFSQQSLTPNKALAGSVVKASFRLVTNDVRVSNPECIMDGISQGWINATLKSGSAMEGYWECSLLVDKSTSPGRYDFHMAVVGYANDEKNEERVILPVTVVANEEELYGPFVDAVYIDTFNPSSTSAITSDRVSTITDFKAGQLIAHIWIPPGKGNIFAAISGPGILGTASGSPLAKALVVNRGFISGTSLYFFSDGMFGHSTVSLTLNGKTLSKQLEFYSAVTGMPKATSSPTPSPTPSPSVSAKPSSAPTVKAKPSTTLTPSATPTPSPNFMNTQPSPPRVASPSPSTSAKIISSPSVVSSAPFSNTKSSTKSLTPKKSTITCIKGKLTKKVTAIKPVCPAGYKKK